ALSALRLELVERVPGGLPFLAGSDLVLRHLCSSYSRLAPAGWLHRRPVATMVEEYDRRRRGNSSLLAAGSQTRRAARVGLSGGSSLTSLPPTWLTAVAWSSIGTSTLAGCLICFG